MTSTLIKSVVLIRPLRASGPLRLYFDNEYYVPGIGNAFTVLVQMYSVTSLNLKLCVLNVREFFYAEQLEKKAL